MPSRLCAEKTPQSEVRNTAVITAVPTWVALTQHPAATSDYIAYLEYRFQGKVYIYDAAPTLTYRSIKVTYKAGYAALPADVSQICNEIVANVIRGILKRRLTPQDISQIVMMGGDIRAVFAEDAKLNESQMSLLDSYKISEVRGRRA